DEGELVQRERGAAGRRGSRPLPAGVPAAQGALLGHLVGEGGEAGGGEPGAGVVRHALAADGGFDVEAEEDGVLAGAADRAVDLEEAGAGDVEGTEGDRVLQPLTWCEGASVVRLGARGE